MRNGDLRVALRDLDLLTSDGSVQATEIHGPALSSRNGS